MQQILLQQINLFRHALPAVTSAETYTSMVVLFFTARKRRVVSKSLGPRNCSVVIPGSAFTSLPTNFDNFAAKSYAVILLSSEIKLQ